MVRWDDRPNRGGLSLGLGVGAVKDKLEELAKQGQSLSKEVYRRAKVLRSSAFEGILLKATWPGDDPVTQELLEEIIKHSIPAFKYARSNSDDDPYHMTMHKIWTKLCEKDWRTICKSLYILNCISRESSVDSCQRFAMAIRSMSRTRNPKNPDHRYFDIRLISNIDEPSESYKAYITSYATYVLYRMKNFSSKFDELKEISESTHEKQVVARLKKAQQCISLALKCAADKNQCNPITGQITKTLVNDLKDLWKQFSLKIVPLIDNTSPYDQTAKAAEKDVASLLKFYSETEKDIKAYLSKAAKSYSHLRLKFPSDISSNSQIDMTKLEAKIAELVSISGGATDDDDDDDEEEDDNDEGEGEGDDVDDDDAEGDDNDDADDEGDADNNNDDDNGADNDDDNGADNDDDNDDDDEEDKSSTRKEIKDDDDEDEENDEDDSDKSSKNVDDSKNSNDDDDEKDVSNDDDDDDDDDEEDEDKESNDDDDDDGDDEDKDSNGNDNEEEDDDDDGNNDDDEEDDDDE